MPAEVLKAVSHSQLLQKTLRKENVKNLDSTPPIHTVTAPVYIPQQISCRTLDNWFRPFFLPPPPDSFRRINVHVSAPELCECVSTCAAASNVSATDRCRSDGSHDILVVVVGVSCHVTVDMCLR